MAVKRVSKKALIGDEILFVNSDKENEVESISPSFAYNLIDIISLDGLNGSPVTPSTGNYKVYVKTDVNGGFKALSNSTTLNANLTGGLELADGIASGLSFIGFPLEIKIVPANVDVAVAYLVLIKQSSNQLNSNDSTGVVEISNLSKTAYGQIKAEQETPITQIAAEYGLLGQVLTVTDDLASGTNVVVNDLFTSQTGVAADGLASILTLRQVKSRAGQGIIVKFDAIFSPGVAASQQAAGLITSENSYIFAFLGTAFGIAYAHDGESESQELTISAGPTSAESASIEVNGTIFTVPLTVGNGSTQHTAFEISTSLNIQVPNYNFTSNDDQVVAQSLLSGPQGDFSFTSATAAATWLQTVEGVAITIDFTPQASWNKNTRLEGDIKAILDPTKGNNYQIQISSNFGAVRFSIEDNDTGEMVLVHMIKNVNLRTTPNVTNPTFRLGWLAQNLGNTTNLTVSGNSAVGLVEGIIKRNTPPRSDSNTQLSVSLALTNIISFRNRLHFADKVNRAEIFPLLAIGSTDAAKPVILEIIANPVFGGDVDFDYLDKDASIIEIATDAVSVSGGRKIGTIEIAAGSSQVLTFNERIDLDFILLPNVTFSIAGRITQGAAAAITASFTVQEDF